MLTKIIETLKEEDNSNESSNQNFYAQYALNYKDMLVNISDIGELKFPLSQENINKLIALSSDAKYGLRENTLLDKEVRDTHEISADKISIQYKENKFNLMLENIAKKLGLAENVKLRAHLHNMLIYSPGQFFKPHQDSEKLKNMIATLVVVLPSPHIGGSLLIEHHKETYHFNSEHLATENLQCIAFYSDCHHEIKKVKQGYRIALTYNLVLEQDSFITETKSNTKLLHALKDYFYNDIEDNEQPRKLVYLFEHSYSEHSLNPCTLKGSDYANTLAFCAAAKQIDLVPNFALVEIHQTWTTDCDDEIDDLIEDSTTFSTWFDEKGNKLTYGDLYVSKDEMCSLVELNDLEPDDTEHEGYMGNYGNTMDYWYRRAALVLWRKSDQIPMNFKLNYNTAIGNLLQLTHEQGNEKEVIKILSPTVLKDIKGKYYKEEQNYLKTLTTLACYVNNKQLAEEILEHFPLENLKPHSIPEIAKLHEIYGANWCLQLLEKWKLNYKEVFKNRGEPHFEDIGNTIQDLVKYQCDNKIAEFLLRLQLNYIFEKDKQPSSWYSYYSQPRPSEIQKETLQRINIIRSFIDGCIAIHDKNFQQQIISYIMSDKKLYPEFYLTEILFHAESKIAQPDLYGYSSLRDYIKESLTQELAQGIRDKNDWSITTPLPCNCDRCKTASTFLHSQETTKIWPIVTADRDHIIEIFKKLELPVDLSVEKKGSPYKLVMVKNARLYSTELERFNLVQKYYNKLFGV